MGKVVFKFSFMCMGVLIAYLYVDHVPGVLRNHKRESVGFPSGVTDVCEPLCGARN